MKKMKFMEGVFILTLLMLLTTGCGGGGGSSDGDNHNSSVDYASKVRSLDLSGAQGIYITGESSKSGSAATLDAEALSSESIEKTADAVNLDPNSVYKITSDGKLERVAIEDKDGHELPRASVKPILIKDLNSLYLILWLQIANSSNGNTSIVPYLVHKGTGYAYTASEIIDNPIQSNINDEQYWKDNTIIQWDENNNFYVQYYNSKDRTKQSIYKIDTSTLGNDKLTVTELPSAYSLPDQWIVDKTGEFILFGGWNGSEDLPVRYLSISTGALHNINTQITGEFGSYWIVGLDNKVYTFVGHDNDLNASWYNISYDQNKEPLITKTADTNTSFAPWARERHIIGGKLIYMTKAVDSSFAVEEINPVKGTVFHHGNSIASLFSLDGMKSYIISGNYIYVFGQLKDVGANGFYKYNVLTRSGKKIVPEDGYDVKKYTVLAGGSFIVEGIRLSDQAYFYGEMAENGTITVTSTVAIGAPKVLFMEAIRPADFMMIDGSPDDWSTSLRILSDVADDNSSPNGDLLYYSQTTTPTQYFGMLEYAQDLNESYYLRISFEGNETLQFSGNNISFLDANSTQLSDAGGIEAKGSVIEFSMPLTTVTTPNVVSVELFGRTSSGDVNTSDSIDKMQN